MSGNVNSVSTYPLLFDWSINGSGAWFCFHGE